MTKEHWAVDSLSREYEDQLNSPPTYYYLAPIICHKAFLIHLLGLENMSDIKHVLQTIAEFFSSKITNLSNTLKGRFVLKYIY